ncbi:MAG: 23S rRNA (guanosine(2251)-2'-O)-methyltransferase RlmB [Thermomicrobiales bacterium]|nr:23S rRNA (guanosine(2251)-2'-O)-methyltransferase RlmB [Thermomicrobiales bacterium]
MAPAGSELLFGRNAVAEALRGRRSHQKLIVAEGVKWDARMQEIRQAAESAGLALDIVPRQLLDDEIRGARHQGVALVTSAYPYVDGDALISNGWSILVLDHIQDPQNVGSLLRAAEAFGVRGVALPRDRSAAITPAVVNASAGAVEHLHVAQVTNVGRLLEQMKSSGYWIVGLDNDERAQSLEFLSVPLPFGLVVGSEGKGMAQSTASRCDFLARIDQIGSIESLNAAIAGSIALFWLTQSARLAKVAGK